MYIFKGTNIQGGGMVENRDLEGKDDGTFIALKIYGDRYAIN